VAFLQSVSGARVLWRLVRTARGTRIPLSDDPLPGERVAIIVPVLNERHRLGACLEQLIAQPAEAAEILVVDGGSTDGTPALVAHYQARDDRIRLLTTTLPRPGWNGKAHGLQVGLEQADPDAGWIMTVDADVRLAPAAVRSLVAHSRRSAVPILSVATQQRLASAPDGLIHPALLTTLVYRFGIPGHATARVPDVQANGQCCLIRRQPLARIGGFAVGLGSICEDVTVARTLADAGYPVGFYEAGDLVEVAMYESWRDTWRNWPRSLSLRDRFFGADGWARLADTLLTMGLPAPLLLLGLRSAWLPRPALMINIGLLVMRLGVLAGTSRAYPGRPWTYWLSPLLDLPATIQVWRSARRRHHVWRGRLLIRDDSRERL
jgi:dolichol-phosphate mannosyltransferase